MKRSFEIMTCFAAIIAGILLAWISLAKGLWLDEFGPYILLHRSFSETLHATLQDVYQSPIYFLSLWGMYRVFGEGEIALRFLSVVGVIVGLKGIYDLSVMLSNHLGGLITISLLACQPLVIALATNVRPYGLCIAAFSFSLLWFIRWIQDERQRSLAISALFLVITVYLHYVFIYLVGLYGLALLIISIRRAATEQFLKTTIGISIALIPVLHIILRMWGRRSSLSYLETPTLTDLCSVLMFDCGFLAIVALVERIRVRKGLPSADTFKKPIPLLLFWMFAPPLVLFTLAQVSSVNLFSPRFYFPSYLATALEVGTIIARHPSRLLGGAALSSIVLFQSVVSYQQATFYVEQWREGVRYINSMDSASPVLVWSGDVEANQRNWLEYPTRRAYFLGPIQYYAPQLSALPLPYSLKSEDMKHYLTETLSKVETAPAIFVLSRFYFYPYREDLEEYFTKKGYRAEHSRFGTVLVSRFEKNAQLSLNP